MSRLKKIIVLWLLVLTVPVHGLAATLMPLMQAQSSLAVKAFEASVSTAASLVDHAHMHHHPMSVSDSRSDPTSHTEHQHDTKHCASCGACCMPALMTSLDVVPTLHPHGLTTIQFFSPFQPSPILHRLDRPPRHSLV